MPLRGQAEFKFAEYVFFQSSVSSSCKTSTLAILGIAALLKSYIGY